MILEPNVAPLPAVDGDVCVAVAGILHCGTVSEQGVGFIEEEFDVTI